VGAQGKELDGNPPIISRVPWLLTPDFSSRWRVVSDNTCMAAAWTCILTGGGLRSLVAMARELALPQRPRVALIYVHDGRENGTARLEHVRRQADHFSLRQVINLHLPRDARQPEAARSTNEDFSIAPMLRPRMVMAALAEAMRMQAERLIWPAQFNADFNVIGSVTEQLVLLRHLADLEAQSPHTSAALNPVIETPLLELTDRQLVELGVQLDVPWHLAWSCLLQGDKPCRVCPGCRRRHAAFNAAGVIDPVEQLANV